MPVELPCNTSNHTKLRLCIICRRADGIDAFRAFPGIFQFAGALLVHVPGNPETLGSAFHWPIRCLLCPETAVPKVSDKKCAKKYQTLIRRLFQVYCPTLTTVQQTWFSVKDLPFFFFFYLRKTMHCMLEDKSGGKEKAGRKHWKRKTGVVTASLDLLGLVYFSFRKNSLIKKNLEMQCLF